MKAFPVLALSALVTCSACSREEVEAKMNEAAAVASSSLESLESELEELDLSALNAEALRAKAGEWGDLLAAKLGEVKDQASAEKVRAAVEPLIRGLTRVKDAIGEELPSGETLERKLDELERRFADNEGVRKVLQPVIDKLRALLE